jgi:hypothetical protein
VYQALQEYELPARVFVFQVKGGKVVSEGQNSEEKGGKYGYWPYHDQGVRHQ